MNVLLKIITAGNMIAGFVVPGIELALKIRQLLQLDPDIKVSIETLTGAAVRADEETLRVIAEWKKKVGLP